MGTGRLLDHVCSHTDKFSNDAVWCNGHCNMCFGQNDGIKETESHFLSCSAYSQIRAECLIKLRICNFRDFNYDMVETLMEQRPLHLLFGSRALLFTWGISFENKKQFKLFDALLIGMVHKMWKRRVEMMTY